MMPSAEAAGHVAFFKAPHTPLDEIWLGDMPASQTARQEASADDETPANAPRLRAIFISDLHIGTPGFQAEALLDFLKHHPSDMRYLVGDIVDGWQLRRRWFWPQSHNDRPQRKWR